MRSINILQATLFFLCLFFSVQIYGQKEQKGQKGQNEQNVQKEQKGQMKTSCINYSNEVQLDLTRHELPDSTARRERQFFHASVSTLSAATIDTLSDVITYTELCTFKTWADNLTHSPCSEFVTGIRMYYGLSPNADSMRVIYQPVKLCKISERQESENGRVFEVNGFEVGGVGNLYRWYSGRFNQVTQQDFQRDTAKYMKNIRLVKYYGGNPQAFSPPSVNNDTTGDVQSVIFSFQEIQELIKDNGYPEHLKVWNSYKQYYYVSTGNIRKQGIFLGPGNLDKKFNGKERFFSDFQNKYANRTHLCPPRCTSVEFRRQ